MEKQDLENIESSSEESEKSFDKDFERQSDAEDFEDYKLDGYHPVTLNETFKSSTYSVIQKLGWGHFSTVWLVNEKKTNNYFALKIQKSKASYLEAALDEIEILQTISKKKYCEEWNTSINDFKSQFNEKIPFKDDNSFCIEIHDSFLHYGMHGKHQCMVFEIMGPNLLDLIQHFEFREVLMPIWIVKHIARQILIGLDFMHRICGIIHTDLKPENVMLELEEGSLHNFVESLKDYNRKPLSMKFLKQLQQKIGGNKKNKKKYLKKKMKKMVKKQDTQNEKSIEKNIEIIKADKNENLSGIKMENNESKNIEIDNKKEEIEIKLNEDNNNKKTETQTKDTLEKPLEKKSISESKQSLKTEDEDISILTWKEKIKIKLDKKLRVKIVDFGNGCWTNKHFTTNIQTREYRSPEAIIGAEYYPNTDIWSFACLIFEMLTNTFLFKPKKGSTYGKNDDHLALMIETLGKMPKNFALSGKYSKDFFNKNGGLINIKDLKGYSISKILVEEKNFNVEEARQIEEFLLPMLEYEPKKRIDAKTALNSAWLQTD